MSEVRDRWAAGSAYEDFMGRWSRQLAPRFVSWLEHPRRRSLAGRGVRHGRSYGSRSAVTPIQPRYWGAIPRSPSSSTLEDIPRTSGPPLSWLERAASEPSGRLRQRYLVARPEFLSRPRGGRP